jgi:hypothetical protein
MQVRRGTASSWTSTNPTLAAGELGFETDTGKFKIGTGSSTWTGLAYATGLNAITYLFNATGGQTTFSGADANGLTLAYTVGTEQVFLNGALQVRGSDYTATNGTSIVLTSGALASDVLNVIAYGATTITDTYTQAQADAKFFQTANAFLAGKNKIINGDFSINQRAFTSTTTTSTYGFDRWLLSTSDGTCTYSAQTFTPGAAPVTGYESINFARIVTTGQTLSSAFSALRQRVEDVRTFANQTVTFSLWAKANSGTPKVALEVKQNFGSGGSSEVLTYAGQATLSTSWTRYSITVAVPSVSGKTIGTGSYLELGLFVSAGTNFNARTGSLGIQSNTFDIWGVQLEAGSIATPFQTATGTLQGELAACQRYYFRYSAANYEYFATGANRTTVLNDSIIRFPVTMRVAPSNSNSAANTFMVYQPNAGTIVPATALAPDGTTTNSFGLNTTVASGLTAGNAANVRANNTSAFLEFSAEL